MFPAAVLLALTLVGPVDPAPSSLTPQPVVAQVAYVSGALVYIDAGRTLGLVAGMTVELWRDGERIGAVRIENLSSSRGSGPLIEGSGIPRVGDEARFTPPPPPDPEPAVAVTAAGATSRRTRGESWFRRNGLWGSLGVRLFSRLDQGNGRSYSQPAYQVRLEGREVGAARLDLSVDTRVRQTLRSDGAGSETQSSVYRLRVGRALGEDFRVTAGRQVSPQLASVSLFDGVLAEYRRGGLGVGAFGGTQPTVDLGWSGDVVEFGAYASLAGAPDAPARWGATLGAVTAREQGTIDRDYLFLRGNLAAGGFAGFWTQEVDLARGWRADAGEALLTPTSTLLSARYRLARPAEVYLRFDNRRAVRTYRDRETPETDFDDTYRTGLTVGGDVRPWSRLRLGLSAKGYGSTDDLVRTYTGTFRLDRLTRYSGALSTRHTLYDGDDRRGQLHTAAVSASPVRNVRCGVHGGIRTETRAKRDTRSNWYGAQIEAGLVRGVFAQCSLDITRGSGGDANEVFASLSYRFR